MVLNFSFLCSNYASLQVRADFKHEVWPGVTFSRTQRSRPNWSMPISSHGNEPTVLVHVGLMNESLWAPAVQRVEAKRSRTMIQSSRAPDSIQISWSKAAHIVNCLLFFGYTLVIFKQGVLLSRSSWLLLPAPSVRRLATIISVFKKNTSCVLSETCYRDSFSVQLFMWERGRASPKSVVSGFPLSFHWKSMNTTMPPNEPEPTCF